MATFLDKIWIIRSLFRRLIRFRRDASGHVGQREEQESFVRRRHLHLGGIGCQLKRPVMTDTDCDVVSGKLVKSDGKKAGHLKYSGLQTLSGIL